MYTLRPATVEDYDFLYDLHEASMRVYVHATWGWVDAFQREMFKKSFGDKPRSIVIIDGVANGVIGVQVRAEEVYVDLIELHPRVQRRGIGAALVRSVLEQAAARRLPAALRVLKVNVGARRLYQRLGFAIVGENETHYDMRYG
jgi:ribosomal protein S18 acetylase RimI-like enzyme